MTHRILILLVCLAFLIALPALLVGFVAGALAAGLVVSYRWGWRAIMPHMGATLVIEEDEDD